MTNHSTPLYIDQDAQLKDFCHQAASAPWLGLDTEFMRERTYRAQLCLIQIAIPDQIVCIDPLAIDDLSPLARLLSETSMVKILHSARQDMETLLETLGALPQPLFDTQIAAALCGEGEQVGYGGLVKSVLGVELEKGHARTDWTKRPLEPEQLRYAADDVRYLAPLHQQLSERLAQQGRQDWLEEDFRALEQPELYRPDLSTAWQRIGAAKTLKPVGLMQLQALAAWREQTAAEEDKPRKWVVPDDTLVEIARRAPKAQHQLTRIRNLPNETLRRHGDRLLQLINETRAKPVDEAFSLQGKRSQQSPIEEAQSDLLMAAARSLADHHGISLASLTSRKEINRLVSGDDSIALLKGWRRALAGKQLQAILKGELVVASGSQGIELLPR